MSYNEPRRIGESAAIEAACPLFMLYGIKGEGVLIVRPSFGCRPFSRMLRHASAPFSDAAKGIAVMLAVFDPRRMRVGTHHRFWLIVTAVIAFLLAALWAKPIH